MKTILLLAITIGLLITEVKSQDIPTLKSQIDTCQNDSTKSLLYGRLAMEYRRSNPDSAKFFLGLGSELAEKISNLHCMASMQNGYGNIHFFQSNYDSAINHYSESLLLSQKIKDSVRLAAMYNNLGLVYSYKTMYDTALELLQIAYQIRVTTNDEKISSSVNNMGIVYQKMNAWEKALEYYLQAAALKEKYNQRLSLSNTLNNIGISLKHLNRYEEAIPYYERSLQIAIEYNDRIKEANAHNNLAAIYFSLPDRARSAEPHYLRSIELKKAMGNKAGLANTYSNYAEWLSKMEQPEKALRYLELSEKLDRELGRNLYTLKIAKLKANVYQNIGAFKSANIELNKAYYLREEELTEDMNNKVAELEVQFETAQKEAEIERLSLESELQQANLARSRNQQLAVGIGSVMAILALAIYYTQRNKKLKAEREAQELQVDALKKRFMELHSSPSELAVDLDMAELNDKLHTPLTEREFDAFQLSVAGKSNAEIAEELFISISTVKFHLRNTYSKMGVGNRKEAFQFMLTTS